MTGMLMYYILIPFPPYKMPNQNKVHDRDTLRYLGWADSLYIVACLLQAESEKS